MIIGDNFWKSAFGKCHIFCQKNWGIQNPSKLNCFWNVNEIKFIINSHHVVQILSPKTAIIRYLLNLRWTWKHFYDLNGNVNFFVNNTSNLKNIMMVGFLYLALKIKFADWYISYMYSINVQGVRFFPSFFQIGLTWFSTFWLVESEKDVGFCQN